MSRIVKILAMVLLLSPVTGLPARAADVNLDPADPVVAVGDTFTVNIEISLDGAAGEQLAGGVIDLGYNDGVVEIIAVAIDPYWDFEPDPGSKSGPGLWEDIGFDVFVNDPVTENTLIASVTLEALAAGTSQLAVLGSSRFFSASTEFFPTLNGASIRVNAPPTANNDSYPTDEETTLAVDAPGVLANDTDVENDPLSAVLEAGPANGTLTFNPDGSFSYTPDADFTGSDSFTYHAYDGLDNSDTATVTFWVGAVNDPPAANNDSYATVEETTLDIAAPGVLANDTDAEGSSLTAALDSFPGYGTLSLNADGSFTYTPDANFAGTDSFTYHASDADADSGIATVTIVVGAVNDPPTANSDSYATDEDSTLSVPAPGVLANDLDAENDTLTAVLDTGPSNGSLNLYADGSFDYTPGSDFNGTDSFSYHASDGEHDSGTATVTIVVGAVNDPPTASNDTFGTDEDTTLDISPPGVLGNDSDVEGSTLAAALVTGPTSGALTLRSDGSFTYTPDADFAGPDSFTYHANDGDADSGTATVTIYVGAVNDAPILETVGPHSTGEGQEVAITLEADDPDGDDLAFEAGDLPPGAQFAPAEGTFSWTPGTGSAGNYRVLFRVTDNGTPPLGAHEYVTITVGNVNRPPMLAPIGPRQAAAGAVLSFEISASDPEGDNLSFAAEGLPVGAEFDDLSRTFTWPTEVGDSGNHTVTFSVTDDGSPPEIDSERITISVGDVNRPPVMDPVGNRSIVEGDTLVITLTATDPDNDVLFYQCDVMPDGAIFDQDSQVFSWSTISGDAGAYPLTFTVTDGGSPPESDTVAAVISVLRDPATNRGPEADAGPDQTVFEGDPVTLNGSNSFDPDAGDTLTYSWEQIEGDPVEWTGFSGALASFTAADIAPDGQALVFRLTVTDLLGLWDEDDCIINVTRANRPPTADAGDDQVVFEDRDTPVILDGSRSGDPDAGDTLAYFWEQIGGDAVGMMGNDQATASFTAPDVGVGGQAFEFRLTVTDAGNLRSEDTCIVNVTWVNEPPSAHSGDDQTTYEGTTVILDGSGSFDLDDGIAAWRWRQTDTSGHPVTLSNPTAEKTTFVAPAVDAQTVLRFELAVSDTYGLTVTGDPVAVTVFDNGITDFAAGITCTTFPCGRPLGLECGPETHLTLLSIYDTYEDYLIPGGLFTLDTRYGVIEMEFRLDAPGTAATITLYLTDPLPAETSWHQYDPSGDWHPIGASLSRSISAGVMLNADRTVMTLTLTDNGQYDQDLTAGVLRTVGGFGATSAAVSNEESSGGGGGGGGSGCFIDTITSR